MKIDNFFAELKRRNVYKVAVAYAVIAWLLIQAGSILFPTFEAPTWVMKVFVTVVAAGFPIALVLAWAFEMTPEGMKRTEDVSPHDVIPYWSRRKFAALIITVAFAAAALLVFQFLRPKPVVIAVSSTAPVPGSGPTMAVIPDKSIAVLPFQNLSDNKENSYFTDGVQDEILTILSKIADLKVVSRTSVMQYKDAAKRNLPEIAQALKVAHVLEGSVQRDGNRVRVTAQLIDARNDTHLWAERYDRDLADVFAIQSEIAQKIVAELQAALSPKEQAEMHAKPTADMDAYDLYLRAKEIDRSGAWQRAERVREEVRLLDEAVARDPAFLSAFCLLTRAHLGLYWFQHDHTAARLEQARKALEAAARLQPEAGEVHLTRAVFYAWGSRDYRAALAELATASRALPNDTDVLYFTAWVERRLSRWDESTHHLEEAMAKDPRNATVHFNLAANYSVMGRYGDAARVLAGVLVWKPNDFAVQLERAMVDVESRADLTRLQSVVTGDAAKSAEPDEVAVARMDLALARRDYDAAEKALAEYRAPHFRQTGFLTPREWPAGIIALGKSDREKAQVAFTAAREKMAAAVAVDPDNGKALMVLAEIDARLNHKDEAIRESERAIELVPASDGVDRPSILIRQAGVYAQTGESTKALDLLERAIKSPPYPTDYGSLKLNEMWDPLRGETRFEKLVESLAPKPDSP
jgi:TolB-like protein/Tfp pilus assembly protein PilF